MAEENEHGTTESGSVDPATLLFGGAHRMDFTGDDLNGGYRPLLLGEHPEAGDEMEGMPHMETGQRWYKHYIQEVWAASPDTRKIRTLRPLPNKKLCDGSMPPMVNPTEKP